MLDSQKLVGSGPVQPAQPVEWLHQWSALIETVLLVDWVKVIRIYITHRYANNRTLHYTQDTQDTGLLLRILGNSGYSDTQDTQPRDIRYSGYSAQRVIYIFCTMLWNDKLFSTWIPWQQCLIFFVSCLPALLYKSSTPSSNSVFILPFPLFISDGFLLSILLISEGWCCTEYWLKWQWQTSSTNRSAWSCFFRSEIQVQQCVLRLA